MGVDIYAVRAELDADPDSRGYASMSVVEVVEDMYIERIDRNRSSMRATEIYNAVEETEWNALSDAQKTRVKDIISMGEVNPFGREADVMIAVFGGGSDTITTLAATRKETISLVVDKGWQGLSTRHILAARAL